MLRDFRFALRTLSKSPGFALVAILSLALGIGANSAIFSLADGIILRPMPVPHASQLMVVQSQRHGESLAGLFQYTQVSYPDYRDLRDQNKSFTGLSAAQYMAFGFAADKNAMPQMKFGVLVSGNFFDVMGVPAQLGRTFRTSEDTVPGRDAVVVLGDALWRSEFGGKPDVVGKTVQLNGIEFTVIGVAPASFGGPLPQLGAYLYAPLAMAQRLSGDGQPNPLEKRSDRQLFVHGRLKPGVSGSQAAAEARVISQRLAQAYPDSNRNCTLVVSTDLKSRLQQSPLDSMLIFVLLGLAVVVLLIACANVTNLMLSRARGRAREIAVRLAIGAGRQRLVRQLLTESLVIALGGGALGLLVAEAGVSLFSQIRIPSDLPILLDFRLDPRVLVFTAIVAVLSAILFGLVPALQATGGDLTPALKYGSIDTPKRRRFLGRNTLVVGQVAGSLLLLVVASQGYRGASFLLSGPAGFRTDHLLTANLDPSLARYTAQQTHDFYKSLLEGARDLTGVKAAALAQAIPLLPGGGNPRIIPEGVQLPPGSEAISILSNTVSRDYFKVMDIPIVEGRGFEETDRAGTPRVAIVNELFAHKYYPKGSAVGKRFRLDSAKGTVVEIVGVARQSKYLFQAEPPVDYMYQPLEQNPQTGMSLLLYTSVRPQDLAGPLRGLVRSLDARQPVIGMRTMEEVFDLRTRKIFDVLLGTIGGLGVLGLVLALLGLYGLMTYSVGLRQREIGIRMAIGADRAGVTVMMLKQGLVLAVTGVAVGVVLWLLASRPLLQLVSARSFSWSLLGLVALSLLAAAGLGAYIPAWRAAHLDPNVVLRQE